MEWNPAWENPLTSYVKHFDRLIGDQRTRKTFGEIIKGIIGAGSLICQQIAGQSAELSRGKKGSQRVIRLATGQSTQRSELDAEHLTRRLREVAVQQLEQAPEDEVWLIADSSDLRKPYAEVMPYLMQVRDLDEQLVPGYRTLNVIGLTPGRRGLLYHRLLSSQAPDFVSEPKEVQQALATVSQALSRLKEHKTVTWLLDSGFDDVAVLGEWGARFGSSRSMWWCASITGIARLPFKIGKESGTRVTSRTPPPTCACWRRSKPP
jgi:hypothetical protein